MRKKLMAILLMVVMLLGMSTVVYADSETSVQITLTVTNGSEFYTSESKDILVMKELEIPYFDLELYGLQEYYYNPECYIGEEQTAGTKSTANGHVTLLHAIIYMTEIFECEIPQEEAGQGALYQSGKLTDYIVISGKAGSSFISDLWGLGYNLNYYINYEYPLGKEGYGASSDQILLEDGDHISIHKIASTDETITGSSFAYFESDGVKDLVSAEKGEKVNFDLKYTAPGADYVTGSVAGSGITVYYTSALTSSPSKWQEIGTTDSNGHVTLDTSDLEAGTYYVGTDSAGAAFTSYLEHAPGMIVLIVTEAEKEIVYGDVNGDSEIDVIDASLVLRYAANLTVDIDLSAADVNGDQEIDSIDASLILRYAAKLITVFPVESNG